MAVLIATLVGAFLVGAIAPGVLRWVVRGGSDYPPQ